MVFLNRFYFGLAIAILLALASNWLPDGLTSSIALTLLLTGAVLIDLVFIPRSPLQVSRKLPAVLRQGQEFDVELRLSNPGEYAGNFLVIDSPPKEFSEVSAARLRVPAHQEVSHRYRLKSYRRGSFHFGTIFYRITGPLGFMQRQGSLEQPQDVVVLPDVSARSLSDLQLAVAGSQRTGIRRLPWRGEGREFESLREHQHDDDFRRIDWKASARKGRLITRHYEMERDQRLMILLDRGRLMSARIGPLCKFDFAANAAIQLSQVAVPKGDLMGYAIFDAELQCLVEPKKDQAQIGRLVRDLTGTEPSRQESDYAQAFHQVLKRCSRRTLIVCFTDLGDPRSAQNLLASAMPLRQRHLVVIVTVSNSEIRQVLRRQPETEFDVYRHVAAMEMWNDYQRTLRVLQSQRIETVSVPAESLSVAVINEYLRIKNSNRL